jgi:hypothetical protein
LISRQASTHHRRRAGCSPASTSDTLTNTIIFDPVLICLNDCPNFPVTSFAALVKHSPGFFR